VVTSRLLSPINYLFIKHKTHAKYSFYIPLLVAALATALFHFASDRVSVFGSSGLFHILVDPMQFLVGFYIAALAAVATFNSGRLDEVMEGTPPRLRIPSGQGSTSIPLTQRKLLSLLFGYLAMMALMTYIVGSISDFTAPLLVEAFPDSVVQVMRYIATFAITFVGANLITTTLLGLYYLSIKLVETDTRITKKST